MSGVGGRCDEGDRAPPRGRRSPLPRQAAGIPAMEARSAAPECGIAPPFRWRARPEAAVPAALVCEAGEYPVELGGPDLASRELEQFGLVRVSDADRVPDAAPRAPLGATAARSRTLDASSWPTDCVGSRGIRSVLPPGWLAAAGTAGDVSSFRAPTCGRAARTRRASTGSCSWACASQLPSVIAAELLGDPGPEFRDLGNTALRCPVSRWRRPSRGWRVRV